MLKIILFVFSFFLSFEKAIAFTSMGNPGISNRILKKIIESKKRKYRRIDLLVVYTAIAETRAGGKDFLFRDIQSAVEDTNIAFQNSEINAKINLVGIEKVHFKELSNLASTLLVLQRKDDSILDEVHSLRERYEADLVSLIVSDLSLSTIDEEGGLSNTMRTKSRSFRDYAFSVINLKFLVKNPYSRSKSYLLAHEIGHNLGCGHGKIKGLYSDSVGRILPGARDPVFNEKGIFTVGTIMVEASEVDTIVPYFSNPKVFYDEIQTGIKGKANCAKTINETAPIVEWFY